MYNYIQSVHKSRVHQTLARLFSKGTLAALMLMLDLIEWKRSSVATAVLNWWSWICMAFLHSVKTT